MKLEKYLEYRNEFLNLNIARCERKRNLGNHTREEKRYYWCHDCNGYHLTKKK